MIRHSSKRHAGFGLLELMLSMVIVALLLIMATRYYSSASTSEKINEALQGLSAVGSAADQAALNTGSYAGIKAIGDLQSYLPDGNTTNPWGFAWGVVGAAPTTSASSTLAITITTDNQNTCTMLTNALINTTSATTSRYSVTTPCAAGVLVVSYSYNVAVRS